MKIKRIDKKLVLNKKTISNLNMKRMKSVNGGGTGTNVICTGFALCSQRPILCDTAQCPADTVEDSCDFCYTPDTCN